MFFTWKTPRVPFGFYRLAWLTASLLVACTSVKAADETKAAQFDWKKAREWWAYQTPKRTDMPAVSNSTWPNQRIDHFILAKLDSENLTPSPSATRRVLARRLYFDLTGLPPTPAEMALFLNDETEDAYERLVEELLQRHAFGERMASMWLNNVRYAEDQAHQVGANTAFFYPNAYLYRDWVINAFNNDLPYNEFIRNPQAEVLHYARLFGLGPAATQEVVSHMRALALDQHGCRVSQSVIQLAHAANQTLMMQLPTQMGRINNLQVLQLAHNNISGPLPTELGNINSGGPSAATGCGIDDPCPGLGDYS